MFSVDLEGDLAKTILYLTKYHNHQPSELFNMTYSDFRVLVSMLEQLLREEQQRYESMNRQPSF